MKKQTHKQTKKRLTTANSAAKNAINTISVSLLKKEHRNMAKYTKKHIEKQLNKQLNKHLRRYMKRFKRLLKILMLLALILSLSSDPSVQNKSLENICEIADTDN